MFWCYFLKTLFYSLNHDRLNSRWLTFFVGGVEGQRNAKICCFPKIIQNPLHLNFKLKSAHWLSTQSTSKIAHGLPPPNWRFWESCWNILWIMFDISGPFRGKTFFCRKSWGTAALFILKVRQIKCNTHESFKLERNVMKNSLPFQWVNK